MNKIKIKPHHFLDILKLHGKGLDIFVPDDKYKHDFYKIANSIISGEVETIIFTISSDDICKPCIYNKNNKCSDNVKNTDKSKELHNIGIDEKLMEELNLIEGEEVDTRYVLELLKDILCFRTYQYAWISADKEELDFRYKFGLIGLGKVIGKYK